MLFIVKTSSFGGEVCALKEQGLLDIFLFREMKRDAESFIPLPGLIPKICWLSKLHIPLPKYPRGVWIRQSTREIVFVDLIRSNLIQSYCPHLPISNITPNRFRQLSREIASTPQPDGYISRS